MMCFNCGSYDLSFSASLFIHAPIEYYLKLSKNVIRKKEVTIQGANWLDARIWCNNCGVALRSGEENGDE